MITLYGFSSNFGLSDPSPFVLKVDAYMRMAGINFQKDSKFSNFRKAPKGKMPYIKDENQVIADSSFIIEHLQKKHHVDMDDWLSEEEKALAYLMIKSLDENFYWCLIYSRWADEKTWPTVKEAFFGAMSFPIKFIVPKVARKNVVDSLFKHGMGRHSEAEILAIAEKNFDSLSVILGNKDYFFGDKICSFDAAAYGFLAQVCIAELDTPLSRLAQKYDTLVRFCQRIHKDYYQDK